MNYAEEAEAALALVREQGSFSVLPGMEDKDFDHCLCGIGWPMGIHHNWGCPAHCICGSIDGKTLTKTTCGYHSGETTHVPVGPSVMTKRWDLKQDLKTDLKEDDGIQQDLPDVHCDPVDATPDATGGGDTGEAASLSQM